MDNSIAKLSRNLEKKKVTKKRDKIKAKITLKSVNKLIDETGLNFSNTSSSSSGSSKKSKKRDKKKGSINKTKKTLKISKEVKKGNQDNLQEDHDVLGDEEGEGGDDNELEKS